MLVEALFTSSADPSGALKNNPSRLSRHFSACTRVSSSLGRSLRMVGVLLVSAGFPVVAGPAFANDVAHGLQLAQQWCMGCHVLPGHPAQTALQGPPSFREIARGGKTANQLRVFLLNPHGAMPPLTLSRAEIDDLIGYIKTLR